MGVVLAMCFVFHSLLPVSIQQRRTISPPLDSRSDSLAEDSVRGDVANAEGRGCLPDSDLLAIWMIGILDRPRHDIVRAHDLILHEIGRTWLDETVSEKGAGLIPLQVRAQALG